MVAAAIAGAAVVGAAGTAYASDQASSAQQNAANTASGTQLGMYNQTRQDQAPWRQSGVNALNALNSFYGLPTTSAAPQYGNTPYYGMRGGLPNQGMKAAPGQTQQPTAQDMLKTVQNLPGYQFQFDQGNKALQQNLAARGLLGSGAGIKSEIQYGQGYASSALNDYLNGLRSLAGEGQVATQATSAAGTNAANQISGNQIYAGNAAASGYANQANALNAGLGGLVNAYGYAQNNPSSYVSSPYDSVLNNGVPNFSLGNYGP